MKYQTIITLLTCLLFSACGFQSLNVAKLNDEKINSAMQYLALLEAEEVEFQPFGYEWGEKDLPILIKDSKLIKITDDDQLTNVAVVDTLASLFWDAVENKEEFTNIKMGFVQTTKSGSSKMVKYKWLDYPTDVLK